MLGTACAVQLMQVAAGLFARTQAVCRSSLIAIAAALVPFVSGVEAAEDPVTANRYYRGLAAGLAVYEKVAVRGGWPRLSDGPVLKMGMSDPNVPRLRERLALTLDYEGDAALSSELFDVALKQGVIRFQKRNGIEPDGVVGPETLKTLNISAAARVKQIRVNLDRWRRMPGFLGDHFVLVNQAGYELEVVRDNRLVLDMRVIVGKNYRQTPMFSDKIQYVEINPFWNVPASIARKDLVPKFANDPGFPAANGFEAFADGAPVDIQSIEWNAYIGDRLPFTLRQRPGQLNALGRAKIIFPNKYNVYLHDTPSRDLFDKTVRAFSSGCIRLEKPMELVRHLLSGNPPGDMALLNEALTSGKNTQIKLAQKTPIHLVYMTAWLDRSGHMQFRPDIYGRDAKLATEAGIQ